MSRRAAAALVLLWPLAASAAVTVRSDAQVELLALVQRLSGDESLGSLPVPGPAAEVLARFRAFRDHPAVRRLRAMRRAGFTGAFPTQYALYLSTTPELAETLRVPALFVEAAGGRAALDDFRGELRDFSAASDFPAVWRAAAERTLALEAGAVRALDGRDPEADLRAYLGARSWDRWVLVPSALLPLGGPSAWIVEEKPGLPDVYVLTGPERWEGNSPDFGPPPDFAAAVWTEAAYTAAYFLYEHCPQPQTVAALCSGGAASFGAQACAQRLWVEAIVSRLEAREFGAEAERRFRASAVPGDGALRTRSVLIDFEADRRRSPSLFDALPRLSAALDPEGKGAACRPVDWTRLGGSGAPVLTFAVDPRLELLSVVWRLADAKAARAESAAATPPYVAAADAWFAGFSTHPAVALLSEMTRRGAAANVPTQVVLQLSSPPELAAGGLPAEILRDAGGSASVRRFVEALRDFYRRSRFEEFLASQSARLEGFARTAEGESAGGLSPEAVSAYLGEPFQVRYRFLLAPLLPRQMDVMRARGRFPDGFASTLVRGGQAAPDGTLGFDFSAFGDSVAHELAHTVTHPLAASFGETMRGPAPKGCNDFSGTGWASCMDEYLVLAVTLRVSAMKGDAAGADRQLAYFAGRGYPWLAAFCDALREYEREPAGLAAYFPRLLARLRERIPELVPAAESPAAAPPGARSLNDLGVAAFAKGDGAAAARYFEAAMKADPDDVEARLNCGVAYARLQDSARALLCYDKAVELAQAEMPLADGRLLADALSSRATLLESLGRNAAARADLEQALAVSPPDWGRRGDASARLQRLPRPRKAAAPGGGLR